jgi:AcrR family transcriptional regulator
MRRTKEEAENTREDILNSATRLFSEKGVVRCTLEEIAKEANVTRGAIYWHFKNKLEIFEALFQRLHRPVIDMLMADLEKDHPEPLLQLQELCTNMLINLEHDEHKRQALELFILKCDYSGELAAYKDQHCCSKSEKRQAFCRYFEKAKTKGKLPPDADPELLTLAVGCYMRGILSEYLSNPEGFNLSHKAPELMRLFFSQFKGVHSAPS